MKYISLVKQNLLLAFGAFMLLTTGCIRESLDPCNMLTLKVENVLGDDITNLGMVEEATLYIFDENATLLETRKLDKSFITSRNEIQFKNYESGKKLRLIAWGNLGDQKNQSITDARIMDELKLALKSQNGVAQSPDSLYYGNKDVITMEGGVTVQDTIIVRLKTGTITIKTEGYPAYANRYLKSSDVIDFTLDNTLDSYDYSGTQTGSKVSYAPESTVEDKTSEWMSAGIVDDERMGGKQNVFAGQNMGCSILRNGQLLQTVTKVEDIEGNIVPLEVKEAQRTDIKILFGADGTISAKIAITPWGVVDDNIDF